MPYSVVFAIYQLLINCKNYRIGHYVYVLALDGRSNVNDMHNTCNINKLLHRREVHLLNFAYKRAHDNKYIQAGNRDLRRFDAPILREDIANNSSFEKSVLYQGAIAWNRQPVEDRNVLHDSQYLQENAKEKVEYPIPL